MGVEPMTLQIPVERPTGICKVMGSTATEDSENFFLSILTWERFSIIYILSWSFVQF